MCCNVFVSMFIKMRVTAMMNAGPLAPIYLTEAGDLFDLLFGGVPVYRDGRIPVINYFE